MYLSTNFEVSTRRRLRSTAFFVRCTTAVVVVVLCFSEEAADEQIGSRQRWPRKSRV